MNEKIKQFNEGQQVKVISPVVARFGEIGSFVRTEDSAIGPLQRVEFPNGEAGLYKAVALKRI